MLGVFVMDDRLSAPAGANRLAFLDGSLDALDDDIGGHLVLRSGDPAVVLAELWQRSVGAETV